MGRWLTPAFLFFNQLFDILAFPFSFAGGLRWLGKALHFWMACQQDCSAEQLHMSHN